MTSNSSLADQYISILMNNQEPAYFAQVPSSIFYCTYVEKQKDGTKIRKKLSSNAIALYTLMRSVAGVNSACWMSTATLAEMLGRSTGSISTAKKELAQPMEQLGGKSLIEITTKNKRHRDRPGSTRYHSSSITFVWPENNAYMALKKEMNQYPLGPLEDEGECGDNVDDSQKNVHNSGGRSMIERESGGRSMIEHNSPGEPSIIETNNRTYRKNPSVNIAEPTAEAVLICSSGDTFSVIEEQAKKIEDAEDLMRRMGCDDNFVTEMTRRFSPQQILDGCAYTAQQLKRKRIGNRFGYLRNAIEKGRKWHDTKI